MPKISSNIDVRHLHLGGSILGSGSSLSDASFWGIIVGSDLMKHLVVRFIILILLLFTVPSLLQH